MIDTHCHLTYDGIHERIEDVLAAAAADGVDRMISVGTSPSDAIKAVALAERFENVWATAGLHPGHSQEMTDAEALKAALRELLSHPKVVAVGEMGLDQHYPDPPMAQQRAAFAAQLELMAEFSPPEVSQTMAMRLKKQPPPSELTPKLSCQSLPQSPVSSPMGSKTSPESPSDLSGGSGCSHALPGVIHNREATDETLAMIADHGVSGDRLVFHCFTGSAAEVEKILAIGARVSFTGITTFKGAAGVAEASDLVPLDRLMIETDAPFLLPRTIRPRPKSRRNEPAFLGHVLQTVADAASRPVAQVAAETTATAERLFSLI